MKNSILCRASICVFFLSTIIIASDQVSWHDIDSDIQKKLLDGKFDLCELANELSGQEPKNAKDTLFKINIMLRAGLDKEAIKTVERLKDFSDEIGDEIRSIYYICCRRYEAGKVAQAVVENFVAELYDINLRLGSVIRHFERTGWSFEDIDKWFVEQEVKAKALRKEGEEKVNFIGLANSIPEQKKQFWTLRRIDFLVHHGKEKAFAQELEQKVRNNPHDTYSAIYYLELIKRLRPERREQYDLSWITKTYKPQRTTQARKIARLFHEINYFEGAKEFYLRALKIPLTNKESNYVGRSCQIMMSIDEHKIRYKIGLIESIAECLVKLNKPKEAHDFMEQANSLREKHNLRANLYLAGRIQAHTGARTIEKSLKKEEQLSKDDPKYWMKRAAYYAGRKDFKKQEHAYLQVLKLAPPAPQKRGKAPREIRASALGNYTHLLLKQGRKTEAYALLINEMKNTPANAASTEVAAFKMASSLPELIDPNEKIIWDWLDSRTVWEHYEERLLLCTIQKSSKHQRQMGMMPGMMGGARFSSRQKQKTSPQLKASLERAEKMAFGNDASRAKILGGIVQSMGYPKRAIPLLNYAIANSNNQRLLVSANFILFKSYLDLNDWKNAEIFFSPASNLLTSKEKPEWFGRIAVVAARIGDKKDAMRLWKKVANCDLRKFDLMRKLASHNMKKELVEYYVDLIEKLPGSVAPGEALKILKEQDL